MPTKPDTLKELIRQTQTPALLSKERVKRRSAVRGRNTVSLVKQVSETLDCTYGEANYFIDLVAHVMKKALLRQEKIKLMGIGTFKTWIRCAHTHPMGCLPLGSKNGKDSFYIVREIPDKLRFSYYPHVHILRELNKEPHVTEEPGPS